MAKHKTQGLTRNQHVLIEGVEGATFEEAANAILLDMRRRLKAGELRTLAIIARDKNNNKLEAIA